MTRLHISREKKNNKTQPDYKLDQITEPEPRPQPSSRSSLTNLVLNVGVIRAATCLKSCQSIFKCTNRITNC